MRVKTEGGKTKDVDIIDVTPENYIVPDNEKHLYHVVQEVRKFSSEDGKRLSIPRIQKYGKKGWETSIETNLKKQGYTITVLHNPNDWLQEKAASDEQSAKAKAEAKAKADADAKAAERDALKAEILAELKASGIIPTGPTPEEKAKAEAKAKADADAKAKTEGKK